MQLNLINKLLVTTCLLTTCVTNASNPDDPYESINREILKFDLAFDATFLKPPAKLYKKILPAQVRAGINNVYNNVNMLPTVANDILQADWNHTIKDTWRFITNSTIGIGGIFDPASTFQLPPHSNDLGLTFAKWGNKKSPYIVIPLLGPSTIRDGMGLMFDCVLFTPYPYITPDSLLFGILLLRYVDLRAQMLDNEALMADAIDQYTFIRDAYLQHRNYLITGEQADNGDLYVDEDSKPGERPPLSVDVPANGTPSAFPLTTA